MKKPFQPVNQAMQKSSKNSSGVDGRGSRKMLLIPARLKIKKGEQIKFTLLNNGELDNEFILAATADNLKRGETMNKNPEMEHDDPSGKRLAPRKRARLSGSLLRLTSSNIHASFLVIGKQGWWRRSSSDSCN